MQFSKFIDLDNDSLDAFFLTTLWYKTSSYLCKRLDCLNFLAWFPTRAARRTALTCDVSASVRHEYPTSC
jgi:hypothetical protein